MTSEIPERGFPPSEFEQRLARAQRGMAAAGFDALLLTTEPEVRWFSGFLTEFWQSPTRPWFLVVPRDGMPIAVIPGIGGPLMARTWIDDIRTWPSPQPGDEGVSRLAEALCDAGAATGRIGLPMGPETMLRMPLNDYRQLQDRLPGADFVDAGALIRELRMVKSEREIAKIAHICAIASDSFEQVPGFAAPGQPLTETFRAFRLALLHNGADNVPYLVGASAPGGYEDVITPPGETPLSDGDILMMDTGALFDGYFCDFDRNWAIGHADDATRRAYATLYRATDAGQAAARPGATCADLFRTMQNVIVADGYECGNVGRLGHGLGMQLTEWPSHTPDDHTVLQTGMVLTLEPGLGIAPGRSMVHEENIVIREHGAELLSRRAPPELPVIG
ncbi:MAG: M24 family metallopeptidase [Halofilum sp. (in: g-proteobacteria)]